MAARADKTNTVLRSREMVEMMTAARAGVGIAAVPCVLGDVEPALRRLTPRVIATSRLVLATRRAGHGLCDGIVAIRGSGKEESLNVAVAASVLVAHLTTT